MTAKQMWEMLRLDFPSLGDTQALIMLNMALDDFASKTRVLFTKSNLTLTTAKTYNLPATCQQVRSVEIVDGNNEKMVGIGYRIEAGTITIEDLFDLDSTTINSDIARVTLRFTASLTAMSALTSTPGIDSRFHMALVHKVKMELSAGDQVRFYQFRNLYNEAVLEGKKYGNTLGDDTGVDIQLYES